MADAVHADGFLGPSPPSSGFSGSFFPKIAIDTSRDGADATPSCVPAASPVREVLLNGVVEKGARGEKPSATIAMPTTRRTTVLRMLWDDTYVRVCSSYYSEYWGAKPVSDTPLSGTKFGKRFVI